MALVLNDSPLADNQARFVIKIESDTPIYLSNYIDGITLSSVLYDGEPLIKNSLQDNGKSIDISNGGGIGNIQAFQLQIARYQTNAALNDFFNDLFPATGKQYLIARPISIGVVWEGATTAGEITWFFYGYIDEYSYNADMITLLCLEYAELENIELPYYKVQKENDNGISYYLGAPEENYGKALPFFYGLFKTTSGEIDTWILCNCVCVNKAFFVFKIATHKCLDNVTYLYKYLSNAGTYMKLIPDDGTNSTNYSGYSVNLYNSTRTKDKRILGELLLRCKSIGGISEVGDITNIIDNDSSNYLTLSNAVASNLLGLKIDAQLSSGEVGLLSYGAGDVTFVCQYACDAAANRDIKIYYYHKGIDPAAYSSGAGDETATYASTIQTNIQISIGGYFGTKIEVTLPWTIEELISLEWLVENTTAIVGTENLRIYNAYLLLNNILIAGILPKKALIIAG